MARIDVLVRCVMKTLAVEKLTQALKEHRGRHRQMRCCTACFCFDVESLLNKENALHDGDELQGMTKLEIVQRLIDWLEKSK